MPETRELLTERKTITEQARALLDAADADKRALTSEEEARYDGMMTKVTELTAAITRRNQLAEAERAAALQAETRAERGVETPEQATAMDGLRSWLTTGRLDGRGAEELRALSATANTEGGYLVMPEQFVTTLIKAVDDLVVMRGLATSYQLTTAASLGAPELTADPSDADWTSELSTGGEDSAMTFGKRSLAPRPLAKRIRVSNKLLRTAALAAEQIVTDRLAYKFAVTEEKAFLTGDGDGKPLGVFTASPDGIPTSRDVATGNSSSAMTFDGLKEAKYSLKAQHQANAVWMFHRDGVKQIAKLKDGESRYLWEDAVREGEPDRLMGRPVLMSEFVPNTFTTGQYVGIIGDFSHYWIVDALDMQMQRLVELYAASNQTGFIGRRELDGAPVLSEAFARVTLA